MECDEVPRGTETGLDSRVTASTLGGSPPHVSKYLLKSKFVVFWQEGFHTDAKKGAT